MKTKGFTKSDSVTVATGCGFQPDLIYVGTGGIMNVTTAAGDTFPWTVFDGCWYPADNIKFVTSATTTASGFIGWQE